MTQDVLLRRGEGATVTTTALTTVTLVVAGLGASTLLGQSVATVPVAGLQDAFTGGTLNTAQWASVVPSGGSVTQQDGYLALTPGAATDSLVGVTSTQRYALTGSAVSVYLFRLLQNATAYVELRDPADDGVAAQVWVGVGKVWLGVGRLATTALPDGYYRGSELFTGALQDLSGTASAAWWLRWREDSGTVYCEVAPASSDNPPTSGQWVTKWSGTLAGMDLSACRVGLYAANELAPNVGYLDAVNTSSAFTDPGEAYDVRLRAGTAATIATPAINARAVVAVDGLVGLGGLGAVRVDVGGASVQPTGLVGSGLLFADFGGDSAHGVSGVSLSAVAGEVVFWPRPAGLAETSALGSASVVSPDTAVTVTGQAASAAVGVPVPVRQDGSRQRRLLLQTPQTGAD